MLQRCTMLVLVLITLVSLAPVAPAQAQGNPTVIIPPFNLPRSAKSKFPRVAAFTNSTNTAGIVSVSANSDEENAYLWEKADSAASFADPFYVGPARGRGGDVDYATAALTYAPDGALFYAWSNFEQKQILMRVREAGQASFGPQILAVGNSRFPADTEVGVTDLNGVRTVFIVWREAAGQIFYRTLQQNNQGVWTPTGTLPILDRGALPEVSLFAGPGGKVAVGYTRGGGSDGDLKAYVAFWENGGFREQRVAPETGSFANPSVALDQNGQYVVAYRNTNNNAGGGVYVTQRNAQGIWPSDRPFRGDVDSVAIAIDPLGNLHLSWSGEVGGSPRVFYSFRRVGQPSFITAIEMINATVFSAHNATNLRDRSYAHVVFERFDGGTSKVNYAAAAAPIARVNATAALLDDGALYTRSNPVKLSFSGITGDPTQVRYRWDAPVTGSEAPLAFNKTTNRADIPAPTFADPNACNQRTIYAQLSAPNASPSDLLNDTITFDTAVQATATVSNPDARFDPGYTRTTQALLRIDSPGECVGLAAASVNAQNLTITSRAFSTTLNLTAGAGVKPLSIVITDGLGNTTPTIQRSIIYDPTPPALSNPGTVTTTIDLAATILVDVEISGLVASDDRLLYGLLITNEVTPSGGSTVVGTAQVVPFSRISTSRSGNTYSLQFTWSLASGLPRSALTAGDYNFTIQVVDAAGNPSSATTGGEATLASAPTFPEVFMPLVRR